MFRKLMLLSLSVAALIALATPVAASATVTFTMEEEPISVGSTVVATSGNLVVTTWGGSMECETVVLHLELLTNGINHVVLKQLGEATTTNCKLNIGIAKLGATITDGTLGAGEEGKITIDTVGTSVTSARFGLDVPDAGLSCVMSGSVHLLATNGTGMMDLGPSELTASGGSACKAGTFEGGFTLSTSDGHPVEIDALNE